MWKPSLR
ncbi:hypothetical protein Nmel_011818 [Mimus melanotis]